MSGDSQAIRQASAGVDRALQDLDAHADPEVSTRVRAVVASLLELYGIALERIVALTQDNSDTPLIERLANDPVIGPLLLVHDVHPHDLRTRLTGALDRERPTIAALGCHVTLTRVDTDVAAVRVEGGSRLSEARRDDLRDFLVRVLLEAGPELTHVDIDLPEPLQLIQIQGTRLAARTGRM